MNTRQKKMIEIKQSLLNLKPQSICPELTYFFSMLQDWADNNKKFSGILNLPEIKKDLVYQLDSPKNTVTVEQKDQKEPIISSSRIGRNECCNCNSGKKYKKCCLFQ